MPPVAPTAPVSLHAHSDATRLRASQSLSLKHRNALGQFLTPSPVAALMASMYSGWPRRVRVLEPGAGTGSLCLALIEYLASQARPPVSVHFVCYEIEEAFLPFLEENLRLCERRGAEAKVKVTSEIRATGFLEAAAGLLECALLGLPSVEQFDLALMNPPYKKIGSASPERHALRTIGLETVNLYSGFLGAAVALLAEGGTVIAITPRSFCNGPYYREFRRFFLERMSLRRLHVFESRDTAFLEDEVLQETVITVATKAPQKAEVTVSMSHGPSDAGFSSHVAQAGYIVSPHDPELFIKLVGNAEDEDVSRRIRRFGNTLAQLGLAVSTGRVVDFRSREHLRQQPGADTVPLIYPAHFSAWEIEWPASRGKKPNALRACEATVGMLLPPGRFVLTKRFSAKEETRRIRAVVYEPKMTAPTPVAFENHVNYFHAGQKGLPQDLAWGLAAYLNSSLVESYFRTFNGHTQVNATDLRTLPYPSTEQLNALGRFARRARPNGEAIDEALQQIAGNP